MHKNKLNIELTDEQKAEKKRRLQVLLWAYVYEYASDSLVSDAVFDETCSKIDTSINTDRPDLDEWFKKEFDPSTGQWIGSLPAEDFNRLREIYIGIETHRFQEKLYNRLEYK